MARTRKVNEVEAEKSAASVKPAKKEKREGKVKKSKKKEEYPSYERYIFLVLKQTHSGISISSKAMSIMNSFVIDIFERIANESGQLVAYRKSNQLTQREIKTACKLILNGDLLDFSINEGEKSLALYNASLKSGKKSTAE